MEHALLALTDALRHALSPVHYFAFFIGFFAWVLLLLVTYALRSKKAVFTLFSLLAFLLFFGAPLLCYVIVEQYVKSSEITDIQIKQLRYIDKAVFKGNLANRSPRPLKACRVFVYALPENSMSSAGLKSLKNNFRLTVLSLDKDVSPGAHEPLYITVDGLSEAEPYTLHTLTLCK